MIFIVSSLSSGLPLLDGRSAILGRTSVLHIPYDEAANYLSILARCLIADAILVTLMTLAWKAILPGLLLMTRSTGLPP